MRVRRRAANFLMKNCGLRKLQGSGLQRVVRAALDELDLQHLRDSHPCSSLANRSQMYRYVHDTCVHGEPVDYLEFGVFQGDSMRQWLSLNTHKDSRFFGFDSFEGLPENWRDGQSKGHFDVGGDVPCMDDPRVSFIKGWFEHTIPVFLRDFSPKNRLLLHVDADLYGSAMLALVHFGPFLSERSLLLFDEFYDREHEFKALMDWQKMYRKKFRIVAEVGNYGRICAEVV